MVAELLTQNLGIWVGLIVSLAVFSLVLGDQWVARLAQHLLVGTGLGYLALLAVRDVLTPRLFVPLMQDQGLVRGPGAELQLWVPLLFGVLLWAAGLDYIREQSQPGDAPIAPLRRLLRLFGAAPLALVLGVGLAVTALGVLQGTLLPQLRQAANAIPDGSAPLAGVLTGVLTLLLTIAALLAVAAPARQTSSANEPAWTQPILRALLWVGQRAIWLVAGLLFARLAAARLSLVIGRMEYVIASLQQTAVWALIRTWWEQFTSLG